MSAAPASPEAVSALFDRLGVLQRGHFVLSSGRHSDTYLQCARALTDPEVAHSLGAALAAKVADELDEQPAVVVSPALGGVLAGFVVAAALGARFLFTERIEGEMALRRGQHLDPGERALVVEDVVTTGGSAAEAAAVCRAHGAEVIGLAVLVDRSGGLEEGVRTAHRPTALLRVEAASWPAEDCPLCAGGHAVDRPGSRR